MLCSGAGGTRNGFRAAHAEAGNSARQLRPAGRNRKRMAYAVPVQGHRRGMGHGLALVGVTGKEERQLLCATINKTDKSSLKKWCRP